MRAADPPIPARIKRAPDWESDHYSSTTFEVAELEGLTSIMSILCEIVIDEISMMSLYVGSPGSRSASQRSRSKLHSIQITPIEALGWEDWGAEQSGAVSVRQAERK